MPEDPKPEGPGNPESAAPAPTPPEAPAAAKPAAPPPKPAAAAPAAKPAAPAAPKAPAVMAATPWEGDLPSSLKEQFGERLKECSSYLGQDFLVVSAGDVPEVIESLRDVYLYDYLVDITAVHYPSRELQFEVVYILYSFARNHRIRVKTSVRDGEKPQTVTTLYPTANWLEREVYDMFGIEFAGHPDMKRILLPDEWEGFPLRKENGILKMDQRWVQENLGIESGQ